MVLHAVAQKKTNLANRWRLSHREDGEHRATPEDDLTSTVLGPLAFLPAAETFRFWSRVITRAGGPQQPFAAGNRRTPDPARMQAVFWPANGGVEPDAHFTFHWPSGRTAHVLVEVKWSAGLSGDDQLSRQWTQYLQPGQCKDAWHVFIGRDTLPAERARWRSPGIWGSSAPSRLVAIPWGMLQGCMRQEGTSEGYAAWSSLASIFLDRIGARWFDGFHPQHGAPVVAPALTTFFAPPFSGFRQPVLPDVAKARFATFQFRRT